MFALVIEDVEDAGEVIRVRAMSMGGKVPCPDCGAGTGRVHGYHERTAADVPVDGRRPVAFFDSVKFNDFWNRVSPGS